MVMTVDIPEKVLKHAEQIGRPVEELVAKAIEDIGEESLPPGFVRFGRSSKSLPEAAADIQDIASKHTLGGIKIRDLIEEGRRY